MARGLAATQRSFRYSKGQLTLELLRRENAALLRFAPAQRIILGNTMFDRRELMRHAGFAALATSFGSAKALAVETMTLPFANGERQLIEYPQKRPMIRQTSRPPQLETPFRIFNEGPITPTNAFFVRYHLADLPLDVDPDKFTLEIRGKVDKQLKLSMRDIKKLRPVEVVAVNQCSGNSIFRAARFRRPTGQRLDGLRTLARRPIEDIA